MPKVAFAPADLTDFTHTERRLDPKDASVLALLARYPEVSQGRRRVLVQMLSDEGRLIAKALDPKAPKQLLPKYVLDTAEDILEWVTGNTSLRPARKTRPISKVK